MVGDYTTPHTADTTPNPDSRRARALSDPMAIEPIENGAYDIITADNTVYTVDLPRHSCTCPDNQHRHHTCKHLYRVAYEINIGTIPSPTERHTTCAACGTDIITHTTDADPVYCTVCTLHPGEPVRDQATGDVLIVVQSTDRRATQVAVPGTDHSVASHPGNEPYDPADRIVEALYPLPAGLDPETVRQRRPRCYAFPRGRLARVI